MLTNKMEPTDSLLLTGRKEMQTRAPLLLLTLLTTALRLLLQLTLSTHMGPPQKHPIKSAWFLESATSPKATLGCLPKSATTAFQLGACLTHQPQPSEAIHLMKTSGLVSCLCKQKQKFLKKQSFAYYMQTCRCLV